MRIGDQFGRQLCRAGVTIVSLIVALLPAKLLTSSPDGNRADKTFPVSHSRNEAASTTALPPELAAMRAQVMSARPLAMYYSLDDGFALSSLLAHASAMTLLAPQCYWLDQNGNVEGGISSPAMDAASRARLPVMALLYNGDFNRDIATLLLHNRGLQRRVIGEMVAIARRENFLGFQLDFENIDPNDENLYSRFVREAASKLHHDGRLLSVAVVPRFLDSRPGQWSAAYDYAALAQSADFLTLMAYDNSSRLGPPGPIAGYNWVQKALEYAVRRVSPEKLLLGIPLYGREWREGSNGLHARTMPYQETLSLLARLSITPRWDEKQRSPWFEYRTSDALCKVWYEDAQSISEKLGLVEKFGLRGFAAWRLGVEDPQFWSLVAAMRENIPAAAAPHYAAGYY